MIFICQSFTEIWWEAQTKKQMIFNTANIDYADDQVFLKNTPAQVESRLHSLDQAAMVIGLCVSPNKTEFELRWFHLLSKGQTTEISTPVYIPR